MTVVTAIDAPPGADGMTAEHFDWFARLVYDEAGIVLGPQKARLVHSRLLKRVRITGSGDFARYMARLERDPDEQAAAIYALTTNHTKFWRESHHFEHFAEVVRPALVSTLERGGQVRLWSAACSSGEEPYSLLMTMLGAQRHAGLALLRRDLRLLATDLSPAVLRTAMAGRYPAAHLAPAPAALRAAWTKPAREEQEIDAEARRAIVFKQLNLLGPWPMSGAFDVIFCRNVMIYFDEPTKAKLQERLAAQLAPGGHLYIGHSERLSGPAERMLEPVGQTIYRKVAR